ncbi:hypothetical protein ABZP36_008312 [Zizania latifolia]
MQAIPSDSQTSLYPSSPTGHRHSFLYFGNTPRAGAGAGAGAGARPPPHASAWKPSFSWEDFADPYQLAPPRPPQPNEHVAENATPPRPGLDLNEPPPDTLAAPAAPATPCSARAPA